MFTDRSAFYGQDLLVWNGKAWDPSTFERVKEMFKCLAFFLQTDLSIREKILFFKRHCYVRQHQKSQTVCGGNAGTSNLTCANSVYCVELLNRSPTRNCSQNSLRSSRELAPTSLPTHPTLTDRALVVLLCSTDDYS